MSGRFYLGLQETRRLALHWSLSRCSLACTSNTFTAVSMALIPTPRNRTQKRNNQVCHKMKEPGQGRIDLMGKLVAISIGEVFFRLPAAFMVNVT